MELRDAGVKGVTGVAGVVRARRPHLEHQSSVGDSESAKLAPFLLFRRG